jgi:mitochondrial import inner membrane translocase subunit TIM44
MRVSTRRTFHCGGRVAQERKEAGKDSVTEEHTTGKTKEDPSRQAESDQETASGENKKESKKQEKKEDDPPPPPHGNKSPWQVFTDTLQSEFKASKEWNESTKALASSAHQFTESESVKRARQAYEASSSAVSSTTANVLKTTAGAVGKGAAWTWETPVVKGVRSTVNATGSMIEKGTRPLRETEAYKNVKNVIDDGSSSRYGGWVEKEERRKAREQRELEEAAGGRQGKVEVPKEDPK